MRKGWGAVIACAALCAMLSATPAEAAFPGQNGKIAFNSGGLSIFSPGDTIEVINPDGTGRAVLTTGRNPVWSPEGTRIAFLRGDGLYVAAADGSGATLIVPNGLRMAYPTWSPDGTQLAFVREGPCSGHEGWCDPSRVFITNVDGTNLHEVPTAAYRPAQLSWSPDGTRFAAAEKNDHTEAQPRIFTVNVDGSGLTYLTSSNAVHSPSWAPDASRIVFSRFDYGVTGEWQLVSVRPDGTGLTTLVNRINPYPAAWAPDGSRILISPCRGDDILPCENDLVLVDPDGGNPVNLTDDTAFEGEPDWQPIPINAYPRPAGAYPMRVSLVPAYQPCSSPNRTHGPPLGFGSCSPPSQQPGELTVGTPDANGQGAKSVGYLRITTLTGNPATTADEADVSLRANITDVRMRSDLSDYTGDLEARLRIQITDKNNTPHPGGPGAATVQELTQSLPIPCAGTANETVGSTCQLNTTVEALVPGAVVEKRRAIWELGAIRVHDGAGNLFMTQGLFVP